LNDILMSETGKYISEYTRRENLNMKTLKEKKMSLAGATKLILDIMFFGGILVTVTLPFSLKWIGGYLQRVKENYAAALAVYFVLGVLAVLLLNELRRIFSTVLREDCFVCENVVSLRRMGNISFLIALLSVVRGVVYMTMAILVVILVFVIAGLFSKVLAYVFEEAVRFKEENDLTI